MSFTRRRRFEKKSRVLGGSVAKKMMFSLRLCLWHETPSALSLPNRLLQTFCTDVLRKAVDTFLLCYDIRFLLFSNCSWSCNFVSCSSSSSQVFNVSFVTRICVFSFLFPCLRFHWLWRWYKKNVLRRASHGVFALVILFVSHGDSVVERQRRPILMSLEFRNNRTFDETEEDSLNIFWEKIFCPCFWREWHVVIVSHWEGGGRKDDCFFLLVCDPCLKNHPLMMKIN